MGGSHTGSSGQTLGFKAIARCSGISSDWHLAEHPAEHQHPGHRARVQEAQPALGRPAQQQTGWPLPGPFRGEVEAPDKSSTQTTEIGQGTESASRQIDRNNGHLVALSRRLTRTGVSPSDTLNFDASGAF